MLRSPTITSIFFSKYNSGGLGRLKVKRMDSSRPWGGHNGIFCITGIAYNVDPHEPFSNSWRFTQKPILFVIKLQQSSVPLTLPSSCASRSLKEILLETRSPWFRDPPKTFPAQVSHQVSGSNPSSIAVSSSLQTHVSFKSAVDCWRYPLAPATTWRQS
jgi:hypothetical protein